MLRALLIAAAAAAALAQEPVASATLMDEAPLEAAAPTAAEVQQHAAGQANTELADATASAPAARMLTASTDTMTVKLTYGGSPYRPNIDVLDASSANKVVRVTLATVADASDSNRVRRFACPPLAWTATQTNPPSKAAGTYSMGTMYGLQYDYGYSVSAPIVTCDDNNRATEVSYDITFNSLAMGEYKVYVTCNMLRDVTTTVNNANPAFVCEDAAVISTTADATLGTVTSGGGGSSGTALSINMGFVPTISFKQPDLPAVIASSSVFSTVQSPLNIVVQGTPGFKLSRNPDTTGVPKPFVKVSAHTDIYDLAALDSAAIQPSLATAQSNLVFQQAKTAGTKFGDAGADSSITVAPKAFVREDGVFSVALAATSFTTGFDLGMKIEEDVSGLANPVWASATDGDKLLSTVATDWFSPSATVTVSFNRAADPKLPLSSAPVPAWSASSSNGGGLFYGVGMPGTSTLHPNGWIAGAPTYDTNKLFIKWTLKLADTDNDPATTDKLPLPGKYDIAVRAQAVTGVMSTVVSPAPKSAPSFVTLKVGIPTTVTFLDANFADLKDTTVSPGYTTLPVAPGASVWGVITMTLPAGWESTAVKLGELWHVDTVGNPQLAFADWIFASTDAAKVKEPAANSNKRVRFMKIVNTTLSFYYKLDLSTVTATTTLTVLGGKLCDTLDTSVATVCNANNRRAATLRFGQFPTAAAGILNEDGNAYVATTLWGAPYDTSAVIAGTIALAAAKTGTVTASDLTIRGPIYNGAPVVPDLTKLVLSFASANFKVDVAVADIDDVFPGTYVVSIPANKHIAYVSGSAEGNARTTVAFTIGWHARFARGLKADTDLDGSGSVTAADDEAAGIYMPQRDVNGPFITKEDDLRLRLLGAEASVAGDADGAAMPLPLLFNASLDLVDRANKAVAERWRTNLLKGVYAASDTGFTTNLAAALTYAVSTDTITVVAGSTPKYIDWRLGVSGLADGEYVFVINTRAELKGYGARTTNNAKDIQVRLVIDRTPPVAVAQTYSGYSPFFANLPSYDAQPLPLALFNDAGTPDAYLKVSLDSTADARGLTIQGAPGGVLSTSSVVSTVAVRPPTGLVPITFKATDEAGLSSTGTFTIPIRIQPGCLITISDKRGASSRTTLVTGSPSTIEGTGSSSRLPLKIVVDFDEPVSGVVKDTLVCRVNGVKCDFIVDGLSNTAEQVSGPTAAPGGRRYTWDIMIDTVQAVDGAVYTFTTDVTGIITGGLTNPGLPIKPADATKVKVDMVGPVGGRYIVRVVPGAQVYLAVPADLFVDGTTKSTDIRVSQSTPLTANGFTFTAGQLGSAFFSGKATGVPTGGVPTQFTLTATDEAGNTGTATVLVETVNSPVESGKAVTAALTVDNSILTFTEDTTDKAGTDPAGNGVDVFPSASFAFGTQKIKRVIVYLEKPDTTTDALSGAYEGLFVADSVVTALADNTIRPNTANDPVLTGTTKASNVLGPDDGKATSIDVNERGVLVLNCPGTTASLWLTATEVKTFLKAIKYVNVRNVVTSATRTVRVLLEYQATSDDPRGALVAMAARSIRLVGVNDKPTVAWLKGGASKSNPTWLETNGDPVAVYNTGLDLVDKDDTMVNAATVQIVTSTPGAAGVITGITTTTDVHTACDSTRDVLALPANYLGNHLAPKVQASWVPATCQLVLTPVGAQMVGIDDMSTALQAVKYDNSDTDNPLDWSSVDKRRAITLTLTDSANSGRAAIGASNVIPAAASLAADDVISLLIDATDDLPVIDKAKIWSQGGALYSTDPFASIVKMTDSGKEYNVPKFPLVVPRKSGGKLWFNITFDLSQDKDASGKFIKGSFAKGAIKDADTDGSGTVQVSVCGYGVSPCTVAAGNTLVSATGNTGLPGWTANRGFRNGYAGTGGFIGTTNAATCANAGANCPVVTRKSDTLSNAGAVVDDAALTVTTSRFDYRRYDVSTLWLYMDLGSVLPNPMTVDPLGTTKIILKFGGTEVEFYVDVVMEACKDDTATTFKWTDSQTYETYIIKALHDTSATGSSGFYGLTARPTGWNSASATHADNLAFLDRFYPRSGICRYPGTQVRADDTTSTSIGRGNFAAQADAMAAAIKTLDSVGATQAARVSALARARAAATGAFQLTVAPKSLEGAGQVSITAQAASSDSLTSLKASVPGLTDVQLDVAVKLGPAGTTFSNPVKVCIFTGDTKKGSYKVLAQASQRDTSDESRGYTDFEALTDQSFDEATGQVCGYTKHFSVFAPVLRAIPTNPIVPKLHLMGGSCPNQCSGHGACRQDGRCACFAGFDGYDCAMRACPSAESWGEDQDTMHTQSECAGRGVCERASGTCSCFDGYEGAACERIACPNDCSGHGKCRLLAELPAIQRAGYVEWELRRFQLCQCDGGYSGPDCSLRQCPFGDDPETNCWENTALGVADVKRQVQRVTLSFVTPPGGIDVDTTTDEFALTFLAANGRNYTTPRVEDIWDDSVSSSNLATALKTLPQFSVMDVDVSLDGASSNDHKKSFLVTFTGATTTGNQRLLECPINTVGTYGCTVAGCQPRFQQLRIFATKPQDVLSEAGGVYTNGQMLLEVPQPLAATGANTAATLDQWHVFTVLKLTQYTNVDAAAIYTYQFVNTKVYGEDGSKAGHSAPATVDETPVPPAGAPRTVTGPYGLLLELTDVAKFITDNGVNQNANIRVASVEIMWRLPTCSVAEDSAAEQAFEKAECSGRGLCNRDNGECECFNGYAGYNCGQQTVYV